MAEFDELDELLSGSLKRAAQPGDSAGVADTIRARVAAGDVGTAAPSGSAPGFGGGALSWIPWVGAIVALGLVGGTLGATGAFGHPIDVVTVGTSSILMPPTVQASSCPGGPVVASVERGTRVVALGRSVDGAEVQVRNPDDVAELVWIPAGELVSDSGQSAVAGLPVGPSCPTVFVAQAPVVEPVTPVTPTKPGKPTKPGQPADTSSPSVNSVAVTTNENCHVVVTVAASDNVAVTGVTITLSGANGGSHSMTASGGQWKYDMAYPPAYGSGPTTFKVVAHDGAGNSSPSMSTSASITFLI
jgi:hypothetical protein